MESLDRYLGALIDLDGARYRLTGLNQRCALLTRANRSGVIAARTDVICMRVADVMEAMTLVVVGRP